MTLTVFDIDGTLCQTSGLDDACWRLAAREVLKIDEMSTDWSDYPHSTDESIACALIRQHHGMEPDRALLDQLRDRFVRLLEQSRADDPACVQATPGASELLSHLCASGRPVAIATGGWTPSAQFKLSKAGLPWEGIPAAYACDAHPREEIIATAIKRAARAHRCAPDDFGSITYVGDGVWDVRAARKLGISFLGIASGERAGDLISAGAQVVLEDFSQLDRVLSALESE